MNTHRTWEFAVRAGTVLAVLGAGTALVNRITLRQLRDGDAEVTEPVTVCVPARDEADRLPDLIADLRAQQGVPRLRVLILDDDSGDDTYRAALDAIGGDHRFTLLRNDIPPPPGWTGKNAACALLATHADDLDGVADPIGPGPGGGYTPRPFESGHGSTDSEVLIFLDADVRLSPGALAVGIHELRRTGASLVCPWPAQQAETTAERLVQPLLAWSWASTLPVALGNAMPFRSMAVACGQFLVFDAAAYRSIGGHASVADRITEDLAIARELRCNGHHTALAAGGHIAATRMYRGASELDEGYRRWLWTAYGGVAGSIAVGGYAALTYWLPPLAALTGRGRVRRIGLLGYAAAVAGRLLAHSGEDGGRLTGANVVSAVAHPLSVAAYAVLSVRSHRAHRTGALVWKGRELDDNR
ncbi:glycosyltransferase [Nocardia sp. NPDC056000]|uniref:glycosyltransferase n=1 Tax=Nocardia sp. NPDC056000 TaxID=3345674 RepID=UPI0035DAB5D4